MSDEEKKAIFIKYNACISDKDLEKAFKNKNLVNNLVDKAIETQYKDNELKILQKIIEKQQKEIEELKEKNKELQKFFDDFEDGKIIDYPIFKQRYISKDKIKAKIEELEKEKEKYFEKQVIQHEIQVLQSLLEKE